MSDFTVGSVKAKIAGELKNHPAPHKSGTGIGRGGYNAASSSGNPITGTL
jgi:hypothetical protein